MPARSVSAGTVRPSRLFLCLCTVLAVTLAGCGGGGDDAPPPANTGTSGTIAGSAVKGAIRNAVVELFQFDASGNQVKIGSGTTGAGGVYSVTYAGYQGGNVLVKVRARRSTDVPSTPASTVVCDLSDADGCGPGVSLGDEIPLPESFEFSSCLPEPPANGIAAPVTPFTDLVVRRAAELRAGAATREALRAELLNAASEVSQLLGGIDVLRIPAIDISNPAAFDNATPQQIAYTALVAAIAGLASDNTGNVDFGAAIAAFAAQFGGGDISVPDLRELLAEAQSQLLNQGRQDESGLLTTIEETADPDGDGQGTFNPQPDPDAGNPAITRAKNAVQEIRNLASSVGELEAPAQAFGGQLNLASEATSAAGDSLFNSLALAVQSAGEFYDLNNGAAGTTQLQTVNDAQAAKSATITIANNGGTANVTVVGEVRNETVNLTATFPQNPAQNPSTSLSGALTNSTIATTGTGPGLRLTATEGTAVVVKTNTQPLTEANLSSVDFDLVAVLEQTNRASPMRLDGTLRANGVRCTSQSCTQSEPIEGPQFNPSALDLDGMVTLGANSARQRIQASLSNATSFNPAQNITSTNAPVSTVTTSAELTLQNAVPTAVVLAAALTAVGPDPERDPIGTVTLTLRRSGNVALNLALANSAANPDAMTLTITTPTGAVITLTDDDVDSATEGVFGVVRVDGNAVGQLTQLTSGLVVVRYNDGTFETLFN